MHQLIQHLENKYLRDVGGAQFDGVFVDRHWSVINELPEKFQDLVTVVDQSFIREKLETLEYFPIMFTSRKACVNSALFCQKALQYLIKHFPKRLIVHEHTPVTEIRLFPDRENEIWSNEHKIDTGDILLCTN